MMKKIEIADLFEYNFFSEIKLSPTEDKFAFVSKKANVEDNSYDSNIFVLDLESKQTTQLTTSNKDSNIVWHPSGKFIYFRTQRNVDKNDKLAPIAAEFSTEIYKISISGGEAQKIFTIRLRKPS